MRAYGPVGLAICALLGGRPAAAEVTRFDSLAALQSTIEAAAPGDVIEVRDGVYTTAAPVAAGRAGAPGRPIRTAAQRVEGRRRSASASGQSAWAGGPPASAPGWTSSRPPPTSRSTGSCSRTRPA